MTYNVYKMFKNVNKFRPIRDYSAYGENRYYRFKYGIDLEYHIYIFVDFILAENALRRTVQREEALTAKFLHIVASTEDEKIQLRQQYKEVENLARNTDNSNGTFS